jgi:hypothetical protein
VTRKNFGVIKLAVYNRANFANLPFFLSEDVEGGGGAGCATASRMETICATGAGSDAAAILKVRRLEAMREGVRVEDDGHLKK